MIRSTNELQRVAQRRVGEPLYAAAVIAAQLSAAREDAQDRPFIRAGLFDFSPTTRTGAVATALVQSICAKCGVAKDLSEFGMRRDGRVRTPCKACERAYSAGRQEANAERARKYRANHPGSTSERTVRYRKLHPEVAAAHNAVTLALRHGVLTRQPCEICGNAKSVAHHDDYSLQLDVRWLCHRHHAEFHAQLEGTR